MFLKVSNRFVKTGLQYWALPKSLQNFHISPVIWIASDTNLCNTATYITSTFKSAAWKKTGDIRRYFGSSVQHGSYPTHSLLFASLTRCVHQWHRSVIPSQARHWSFMSQPKGCVGSWRTTVYVSLNCKSMIFGVSRTRLKRSNRFCKTMQKPIAIWTHFEKTAKRSYTMGILRPCASAYS